MNEQHTVNNQLRLNEADARAYLNQLAKPPGSLGQLEDLAARLSTIQQTLAPQTTPRRSVLFAADHGVVAAGVSAWPAAVTRLMVDTILSGRAASSVLACTTGTELWVVDVGVLGPIWPDSTGVNQTSFKNQRVRDGSRNLAVEPALSVMEFRRAVEVGRQQAQDAAHAGVVVLSAGEMGIGNSTAASCLTALITAASAEVVTGAGAGATGTVLERKKEVVRTAVLGVKEDFQADPERAIAAVSGLEIAAMAGLYQQAAADGLTIILDGFIATSAALIAQQLWPGVTQQMIAAHRSAEPGHTFALEHLKLTPVLDGWNLRLGEGTGALLIMPLLDAAAAMIGQMATLQQLGIQPDVG